jgi:hypothetical protein
MGLLNPFNRAPEPAPDNVVPSDLLKIDTLLPTLRSWWSFASEALTDRIFGTEAPARRPSAISERPGVAPTAEGTGVEAPSPAQLQEAGRSRRPPCRWRSTTRSAIGSAFDGRARPLPVTAARWYDAARPSPDLARARAGEGRSGGPWRDANTPAVAGRRRPRRIAGPGRRRRGRHRRSAAAWRARLRDGQWTDLALDAEELAPFYDLMRGQWTREYAEQKQLLDQLYAQSGDDILVASYAPMQNRHTGKPFCMTFWVDGFVNLLPRPDAVVLKSAAEVMVVPWRAATAVIPHRLAPTDDYPIRYRAESFPDAAELEQLRVVATLAKPMKAG